MLSENLKYYRKKVNLSQKKLAELLFMSQQGYAKYEIGSATPDPQKLNDIANLLNCSMEDLLNDHKKNPLPKRSGTKIPVFGEVAAGIPISAIEDILDYEEITEDMAHTGEYFGLMIKGDSMEPRMKTGDVVIVKSQPTIENGEIAIVMVNGDTATCKKIKKTPEGIMLLSFNPAHEPIFYTNNEIEQLPVRILGKVVELRAKF